MEAGGQVFFSLSIGYGGLTLFSSGNKWNNDFCSDALVISIANSATSLWASIIMFSFFGFHMNFEVEQCRKTIQSNNTAAIAAFMLKENIEGSATLMGLETGTKNCSSYFFYEKVITINVESNLKKTTIVFKDMFWYTYAIFSLMYLNKIGIHLGM